MTDFKPLPGGCNIGCGSCAFRKSSPTRAEPYNAIRALLCELGGVPFYCHYDKSGRDFHHTPDDKPVLVQLRVCEGWKAAVRKRAANPEWREDRSLRKTVAGVALGAVERLAQPYEPHEREQLLKTIADSIAALVPTKKFKLKLPPEERNP